MMISTLTRNIRTCIMLALLGGWWLPPAAAQDCNNPISGKTAVVDEINTGLACLLCANAATQNVIDGDLSNFVEVTNLATLPGTAALLTVKDIQQNYAAGRRTGFVIQPIGGLLSAGVLANFRVRTYLDNVLQETAALSGGGSLLNVNLLGGTGSKQRLDFVTTLPFDEVELVVTGALTGLNTIRVFYAYEEAATGCDYNCINTLTTNNYAGATASTNAIGGFTSVSNVTNTNIGDFASRTFLLAGSAFVDINIGQSIPGGYDVGFAIEQSGLLGLLSLDLLANITITTYNGNTVLETIDANSTLANVGVLSGGINLVSFKTATANPFNRVRINFNIPLSLINTYRVYYGFVRADDDNDGFPNCVDKCLTGNDNLDADGDGAPDACDPVCTVNAGLDISVCPPSATAQLLPAGTGQSWSANPGNPSPATIDNNGVVSGLVNEGTYVFTLSEGACSDEVVLEYRESAIDLTCNDPISGFGAVIGDGGLVGGLCVLCSNPQATNVIDGDLSNFVEYTALLSLLSTTSLIAVEDVNQTYPAGTRTGFVVSVGGGLLDAAVLSDFQIRTYLNGALRETATTAGGVLGANSLAGAGNLQRISFVATQEFDEVELLYRNTGGVLTSIRVYYAFEENAATCPNTGTALSCLEVLSASSTYCGMIDYARTGFTGAACALCELDNLGHLIDDNTTNVATLTLTAGALSNALVAVKTRQTIPAGYEAGFAISGGAQLLNASVLGGLRLTTYLGGTQRETILATSPLLNATLLGDGSGIGLLSFRTTLSFDEVQLTVQAPVSANVLSNLSIYYAFVRRDTDGDGTPDCYDKCCNGNDNLDADGNGVPDGCDAGPTATDDVANVATNTATNINVLANDNFGADGPGSLTIIVPPSNGTASVFDNGTPADPSDDYIIYTSAPNFIGTDALQYRICDSNGSCDAATVTVNVTNPTPLAQDDINNTLLNTQATGNVLTNDTDPNGSPLSVTPTPVIAPTNGTVVLNPDGTYTYTPNNGFLGTDQFTYQVCNAQNFCDNAVVTVNVLDNSNNNNPPVAHDDQSNTLTNTPVTGNVLNNDVDPDGNALTVTPTPLTPPANGNVVLNPNGSYTYTPNNGFVGTDQFTYQVCDPSNACDQATVFVQVNQDANGNTNDAPFAQDDAFLSLINTPINGNVRNNDSDPNGDNLTVTTIPVSSPTNGTLQLNSDGTFVYTPNTGFTGNDQFTYQICDPSNACDVATVYINVTDLGNPDLTPTITVTPSTGLQGASPMRVIIEVKEINNAATNGQIIVVIPKVNSLNFTWMPTATTVGGISVNNAFWTFEEIGSLWVFRSNAATPLPALSSRRFGFVGIFDTGSQNGNLPFTVNLINGAGGDTIFTNNNDDDTVFFQAQQ